MVGTIFNIQKFCVNDGNGIRTTVFLKGCPLNCSWCHNPESKKIKQQIFYNKEKCILCGNCLKICEHDCHYIDNNIHKFNREKCTMCVDCTDVCHTGALELVGNRISVDDVMKEVLKDKTFYETSNGGLTVSGGEPMLQFEFTLELLKNAKENGIDTAVETCGYADTDKYKKILPYVDTFLYDYKITNKQDHIKYTGVSNEIILNNLMFLNENNACVVLRCPIIPSINDNDEHFSVIGELSKKLNCIKEINVEPYHPLGESKALNLGIEYNFSHIGFTCDDLVELWIESIQKYTDKKVAKA